MNIHKNARTTPQSRAMLVHRVLVERWPVAEVAMVDGRVHAHRVQVAGALSAEGVAGLQDRSSAARRHPHALPPAWIALVRLLRQAQLVAAEIAARLPLARSTISAVLARIGLGRLRYLSPPQPVQRYEWQRPGELVHVDIKKLGRFTRAGHRVTGHRQDSQRRPGLGICPCRHRRLLALWLCRNTAGSEALHHHPFLVARRARIPAPRHPRSTRPHRQRRCLSLAARSARPAAGSASPPNGRDLTGHKPTAKRNASSRPCNANGPTQCPTTTSEQRRAALPAGCASTMRIDPMLAFIDKHQSADWLSSLNNGRRNHN